MSLNSTFPNLDWHELDMRIALDVLELLVYQYPKRYPRKMQSKTGPAKDAILALAIDLYAS